MSSSISAVQKELNALRGEIDRHNDLYYQHSAPEISDFEFDMLLERLKELEAEHPDFVTPDSPTQRIGGKATSLKPFVHTVPLMSLDNSYDLDDLRAFTERCERLADGRPVDYVAELKIDGLSVALHYETGYLTAGATRGDGLRGDDVTPDQSGKGNVGNAVLHQLACTARQTESPRECRSTVSRASVHASANRPREAPQRESP